MSGPKGTAFKPRQAAEIPWPTRVTGHCCIDGRTAAGEGGLVKTGEDWWCRKGGLVSRRAAVRRTVSGPRKPRNDERPGHSVGGGESAGTPDSVFGPLGPEAAIPLGRRLPDGSSGLPGSMRRAACSLLGLAPDGVYRAAAVARSAGALLPHRCTLTCDAGRPAPIGGLFSVALSCESPRLGVAQHPALRSPDVPRHGAAAHP